MVVACMYACMHTRYPPLRRLKLTGLMHFEHGAFLLPLAGLRPWHRFELRTLVYVGDAEVFCTYDTAQGGKVYGGHGFSLLYGDLRRRGLSQLGASAGLRMQFGTSEQEEPLPTLSIMYDNLLVMRLPQQPRWRSTGDAGSLQVGAAQVGVGGWRPLRAPRSP